MRRKFSIGKHIDQETLVEEAKKLFECTDEMSLAKTLAILAYGDSEEGGVGSLAEEMLFALSESGVSKDFVRQFTLMRAKLLDKKSQFEDIVGRLKQS
jgi:hypothetical protein